MALRVTLLLSVTAVVLAIIAHNKDPEIISSLLIQGIDGLKKASKTFNHYYNTCTAYFLKYLNLNKIFPNSEEGIRKNTPKIHTKEKHKKQKDNNLLLSKEDLLQYNGEEGSKGLYVGILGSVFDVETGREHYGPGGGYHFFAGKDGSRAFISGDFTEAGLIDDVSGLSSKDLKSLHDWYKFYLKDYTFVGKVVGNFYDIKGKPTPQLHNVLKAVKEVEKSNAETEKENQKFPPCNVEWSKERGSRVWCTTKSGGIDRSWAGVPRRLVKAGGKKQTHCVCVEPKTAVSDPRIGEYEDCPPGESSCWVRNV